MPNMLHADNGGSKLGSIQRYELHLIPITPFALFQRSNFPSTSPDLHHRMNRLPHHQRQQTMHHLRRRQHRRLPRIIVRRRHLDHIRSYKLQTTQPINHAQQLPRRPPANLGRPRRRRERRIQHVNIHANIHLCAPYSLLNRIHHALNANAIDIPGAHDAEPAARVVGEIVLCAPVERTAHARVDGAVGVEQAFFVGNVQKGAVVYAGVVGDAAADDGGGPGVDVGVEVDYADGSEVGVRRAEGGEGGGVVAAEGEDARNGGDGGVVRGEGGDYLESSV